MTTRRGGLTFDFIDEQAEGFVAFGTATANIGRTPPTLPVIWRPHRARTVTETAVVENPLSRTRGTRG